MDIHKLAEKLQELGQPAFRLEQIKKAVFQDGAGSWEEITTLSKELRHSMSKWSMLSFTVKKILVAKDGQSVKALLKLKNSHPEQSEGSLTNIDDTNSTGFFTNVQNDMFIETVLISPLPGTWSACISCQVGCPMGCRFCATGKLGLQRNLTAEEITDQVLFWKQYLKGLQVKDTRCPAQKANERHQVSKAENSTSRDLSPALSLERRGGILNTIVYMGMGEPFLNWVSVRESLENLIDPELFGIGSRSISVSTCGIPEGIEKLASEFPQINLALSLHFADDQKRSEMMPANRKNNLAALKKALQNYFAQTKRKVFLEYVLLNKINDSREDAEKLVRFVKSIGKLQLLHINLIRYNATGSEFKASSQERTLEFKKFLLQNHIPVTIRKSLGEEIQGACGQLAGR